MRSRSLAAVAAAGALAAGGLALTVPAAVARPPGKGVPMAAATAPKWRDASPHPALMGFAEDVSCATRRSCLVIGDFAPQFHSGSVTWNGTRWSPRPTFIAGTKGGANRLQRVSCPKVSFCMGVGQVRGITALAERWNGSRWTVTNTPRPAAELTDVSCSSPESCTAVGTDPGAPYNLLAERWNGRRWRVQPTASSLIQFSSNPGVSCSSARSCVAVWSGVRRVAAEIWNGTTWKIRIIHLPKGATSPGAGGVSCSSPDACTAVGGYFPGNGSVPVPLAERWNGKSWRTMTPAVPAGTGISLGQVSCASARLCAVTGSLFTKVGHREQSSAEVWTGGKWFVHTLSPPEDPNYFAGAAVSCAPGPTVSCMTVGSSEQPDPIMWAEHYS